MLPCGSGCLGGYCGAVPVRRTPGGGGKPVGRGTRRTTDGTTSRIRSRVLRKECPYTAVPTTLNTLLMAAPMTVPVTPKNEATTVAEIAASAAATTWVSESCRRAGGSGCGGGPSRCNVDGAVIGP